MTTFPRALSGAVLVLMSLSRVMGQPTATTRIVTAADGFLSTLDEQQRKRALFAFDDEEQRKRWSNFPTGIVQRAGINFKEMTAPQQKAAMALLTVVLSPRGLEKVQQIMDGDEVLKTNEGGGGRGGGPPRGNGPNRGGGGRGGNGPGPGGNLLFGKDLFYFSILGTPSTKAAWMLQFGGHHLALNITINGEQGILTPTLTEVTSSHAAISSPICEFSWSGVS